LPPLSVGGAPVLAHVAGPAPPHQTVLGGFPSHGFPDHLHAWRASGAPGRMVPRRACSPTPNRRAAARMERAPASMAAATSGQARRTSSLSITLGRLTRRPCCLAALRFARHASQRFLFGRAALCGNRRTIALQAVSRRPRPLVPVGAAVALVAAPPMLVGQRIRPAARRARMPARAAVQAPLEPATLFGPRGSSVPAIVPPPLWRGAHQGRGYRDANTTPPCRHNAVSAGWR
jgi:hypothetical protein